MMNLSVEVEVALAGGFDAAHEIAAWLKHLVKTPDGKAVLTEHALESRAVRPFFDSWGTDQILRDAHEHALAWRVAHTEQVG